LALGVWDFKLETGEWSRVGAPQARKALVPMELLILGYAPVSLVAIGQILVLIVVRSNTGCMGKAILKATNYSAEP